MNRGPAGSPVWLKNGERCLWAVLSSLIGSGVRHVYLAGRTPQAIRNGHPGAAWIDLITGGSVGHGITVNGACLSKDKVDGSKRFSKLSDDARAVVMAAAVEESACLAEGTFVPHASVGAIAGHIGSQWEGQPCDVPSLPYVIRAFERRASARKPVSRKRPASEDAAQSDEKRTKVGPVADNTPASARGQVVARISNE